MQCILFAFQNESENEDCESDQSTANQQSIRNVTRPCQLGFDKNLSNQVCISLDLLLNRSFVVTQLSPTNIREQRRWVTSQESKAGQRCWELLRPCQQWCANGCNNSPHCWPNNVGSCCVRVSSGVQTDATTPNNTKLHVTTCNRVCKRAQHTCNFQQFWELLANKSRPFARDLSFYTVRFHLRCLFQHSTWINSTTHYSLMQR